MSGARPEPTRQACVMQVIRTVSLVGRGTEDDVCREVIQYWSVDGDLLAEVDHWKDRSKADGR